MYRGWKGTGLTVPPAFRGYSVFCRRGTAFCAVSPVVETAWKNRTSGAESPNHCLTSYGTGKPVPFQPINTCALPASLRASLLVLTQSVQALVAASQADCDFSVACLAPEVRF